MKQCHIISNTPCNPQDCHDETLDGLSKLDDNKPWDGYASIKNTLDGIMACAQDKVWKTNKNTWQDHDINTLESIDLRDVPLEDFPGMDGFGPNIDLFSK